MWETAAITHLRYSRDEIYKQNAPTALAMNFFLQQVFAPLGANCF
jgi:hypothetical protein